jgi:hypothetical protein
MWQIGCAGLLCASPTKRFDMSQNLPPDHEAYIAALEMRVEQCGLARPHFTITYQEDMQGYEVVVAKAARLSTAVLNCLVDTATEDFVSFEDTAVGAAFNEIITARFRPKMMQDMRESLNQRGLLASLPMPGNFTSTAAFLVAIEEHCGFAPGQILKLRNGWAVIEPYPKVLEPYSDERFGCVISSLLVSGFESFSFVGNEALDQP